MDTIEKLRTIAKKSINPLSLLEDAIISVDNITVEEDGYVMLKSHYTPLSTIKDLLEKAPFGYKLDLQIKYPNGYKKLKLMLEGNQND